MKINDVKHNHSLTDLLKVLLFAILMFAPFLSVASRCLYVIANKNAYQSYSNQYVEKYSPVNNSSAFIVGQEYLVAYDVNSTSTSGGLINVSDTNLYDYFAEDINNRTITGINFVVETYARINLVFSDTTTLRINNWNETTTSFVFTYESTNINGNVNLKFINIYGIVWTHDKLDNVFEYSVSKLATDQMFSWTANTPVFSGINAMCTQLGITAPAIPIIIAYWLILACVYIVIDIVIVLITYITHMITRKAT